MLRSFAYDVVLINPGTEINGESVTASWKVDSEGGLFRRKATQGNEEATLAHADEGGGNGRASRVWSG